MAQVSETEPSGAGVLVTGADGFVGAALCGALTEAGVTVRRAVRGSRGTVLPHAAILVGDIGPKTDWRDALAGATCVVRLAAPPTSCAKRPLIRLPNIGASTSRAPDERPQWASER